MNLKFKIFLVLTLIYFNVNAQQDAQYTNYMYNTLSINPAYAGSRGHFSALGLVRTQWLGVDGAPQSQSLTIDSPIGENVGLGLCVVNDKLGPSSELYIDVSGSYKLNFESNQVTFGLKGGGRILNVDLYDGFENESDVESINNKFLPTLGCGLYWNNEDSYIGFSVPSILVKEHYSIDNNAFSSSNFEVSAESLHYYVIAGKVLDLSPSLKFKPSIFGKFVAGAPAIIDLSANFLFNNSFRAGIAYRWDDSVSGLLGIQISTRLLLGYAYDLTTTRLGDFNSGTHEIMLRYDLITEEKQLKSPRFF